MKALKLNDKVLEIVMNELSLKLVAGRLVLRRATGELLLRYPYDKSRALFDLIRPHLSSPDPPQELRSSDYAIGIKFIFQNRKMFTQLDFTAICGHGCLIVLQPDDLQQFLQLLDLLVGSELESAW